MVIVHDSTAFMNKHFHPTTETSAAIDGKHLLRFRDHVDTQVFLLRLRDDVLTPHFALLQLMQWKSSIKTQTTCEYMLDNDS